jgi:hypothetical protein
MLVDRRRSTGLVSVVVADHPPPIEHLPTIFGRDPRPRRLIVWIPAPKCLGAFVNRQLMTGLKERQIVRLMHALHSQRPRV